MKRSSFVVLILVLLLASFWGGTWYTQREAGKNAKAQPGRKVLYYVDPMNPSHTSDKPGVAPCGMPLEPVYADDESPGEDPPKVASLKSPGTVRITPQKQQIIGVQVGSVEMKSETHVVRTLGRVVPDENRVYQLVATAEGWVREVHGSTTGSLVQMDQLMALIDVYSNDFFSWQQQYLVYSGRGAQPGAQQPGAPFPGAQQPGVQPPTAHQHGAQQPAMLQPGAQQPATIQPGAPQHASQQPGMLQHGTQPAEAKSPEAMQDETDQDEEEQAEEEQDDAEPSMVPQPETQQPVARQPLTRLSASDYYSNRAKLELLNLGVGETQLEELEQTRQYGTYIEVRSPVTGLVLSRNVSSRQRVEKGTEFFKVADLSHVWIVADAFSVDAQYLRPGMSARVSLPQQSKSFEATVSDVPPQFDATTRTLKVRLETANPDYVLRPEMFVDVEFLIALPPAITVPTDAVLDSGLRKTVFVDLGNGFFEPRSVATGWRFGDRVEIVEGLMPGERIVVSGNFLIDSESRMKLAAAGFYGTPQKDPVCGMEVYSNKAKTAGLTSNVEGKTYYFCSEECKAQFEKEHARHQEMPVAAPESQSENPPKSPFTKGGFTPSDKMKRPSVIPQDPVCGMIVDESQARAKGLTSDYREKTYFFCTKPCKERFERAPEHFLKEATGGKAQHHAPHKEEPKHD